jgi:alpha-tubulin suppressor-like RCC1 family protein
MRKTRAAIFATLVGIAGIPIAACSSDTVSRSGGDGDAAPGPGDGTNDDRTVATDGTSDVTPPEGGDDASSDDSTAPGTSADAGGDAGATDATLDGSGHGEGGEAGVPPGDSGSGDAGSDSSGSGAGGDSGTADAGSDSGPGSDAADAAAVCAPECPDAATCVHGSCQCPGVNPAVCNSACVDRASDLANCGACGAACSPEQECLSSSCVGVTSVGLGAAHSCVTLSNGAARCWGVNYYGQLGDGSDSDSTSPVDVEYFGFATAIAAADNHTCALVDDGTMACWGDNEFGQLGDGVANTRFTPDPAPVLNLTNVKQIAARTYHNCARRGDGTVWCFGYNGYGQLGDGTKTTPRPTPVQVSGVTNAVQIGLGTRHACAVLATGHVVCWGDNEYGQLGNGSKNDSQTPVEASGITNAVGVCGGEQHTCAVLSDGGVRCWGLNGNGALGDGTNTQRLTPVAASGITTAVQIVCGKYHTCARLSGGTVQCWGDGSMGQLGDERAQPLWNRPSTTVYGISSATDLVSGEYHTCVRQPGSRALMCWGTNDHGELGYPSSQFAKATTPVVVAW